MSERLVKIAPLPAGLAPPVGRYAHATIMNGLILVSGLLALNDAGALVGRDDAGEQARFIFQTLAGILQAADSDLEHIALYLTSLQDRSAVNAARQAAFGEWKPASTLVQVAGLIGEGTLVEIEAIAAVRPPQPPQDRA